MRPVATYVFVDLECSSLPSEDNNRTKITELSLVAVKRDHVLGTRPGATPRVQHKLTLCINPRKFIQPSATEVTGLCNELLEHEPAFDMQVFNTINTFLNLLTKPVCLISQNGHNFDFPILKNHFVKLQAKLSKDILCADSLHAFYDIEHSNKPPARNTKQKSIINERNSLENKPNILSFTNSELPQISCEAKEDLHTAPLLETVFNDEPDFCGNLKDMQAVNEVTPKQARKRTADKQAAIEKAESKHGSKSKVRRKLFWGDNKKPTESYKLKDVYMRVLNRQAANTHRAENDSILMSEVAVALGKDFIDWVDNNNCLFSDIKPMTIGVPLGE